RRARASTSREARAGPRAPRRSASPRRARRAPRPSRSPPTRRASRGSPAAPSRRARTRGPSPRTPPPRRRRAAAARSGSAPRAGARRESRRSSQPGETRRTGGRTAPRISDRRSFRSTRTLSDRMGRFLLSLVAAFLGALAAFFFVLLFGATLLLSADTTPRVEAASVLELELGGRIPEVAPLNPFGSLVGARATTLRDVTEALEKAAAGDRIAAVWLKPDGVNASWATLSEVRAALEAYRATGKPLLAS